MVITFFHVLTKICFKTRATLLPIPLKYMNMIISHTICYFFNYYLILRNGSTIPKLPWDGLDKT